VRFLKGQPIRAGFTRFCVGRHELYGKWRIAIGAASLLAAASGSATVRQPFDPLVLLQDKAAQTTVLRSFARSANLEVATLALG